MKAIKTKTAIIPVESFLYEERFNDRISIYIKTLPIPHNVIHVTFSSAKEAQQGLEELYTMMTSE